MADFFSPSQQRVLFWAPKGPAVLSVVLSLFLIRVLFREKRLDKVYGRLWLGLSICNVFIATMIGLVSSLTAPRGIMYGAMGTEELCQASAGILHFFYVATMVYNGSLGAYFFICVYYNLTERQIGRKIEPLFHGTALLWPTIGVVVAFWTQYYNAHPMFLSCTVAPTPFGCSVDRSIDCEDGDFLRPLFIFGFGLIAMNPATLVKMFGVFAVVYKVYSQQRLMRSKYNTNVSSNLRNRLYLETMYQALGFALACAIPYCVIMGVQGVDMFWNGPRDGKHQASTGLFVTTVIAKVLHVTQGIWNVMVYLRPAIMQRRRDVPEESFSQAIRHVYNKIFEDPSSSTKRPLGRQSSLLGTLHIGSANRRIPGRRNSFLQNVANTFRLSSEVSIVADAATGDPANGDVEQATSTHERQPSSFWRHISSLWLSKNVSKVDKVKPTQANEKPEQSRSGHDDDEPACFMESEERAETIVSTQYPFTNIEGPVVPMQQLPHETVAQLEHDENIEEGEPYDHQETSENGVANADDAAIKDTKKPSDPSGCDWYRTSRFRRQLQQTTE